jgi:hypothetical protein
MHDFLESEKDTLCEAERGVLICVRKSLIIYTLSS